MNNIIQILNVLKENQLMESYTKIVHNLVGLRASLYNIDIEVKEVIQELLKEGNFTDINNFTSIPDMGREAAKEIDDFLNSVGCSLNGRKQKLIQTNEECIVDGDNREEKIIEKKDIEEKIVEKGNIKDAVKIKKVGIATSFEDLEVGVRVQHSIFGVGEIQDIQIDEETGNRVMTVFLEGENREFQCIPEILSQYFGINVYSAECDESEEEDFEINFDSLTIDEKASVQYSQIPIIPTVGNEYTTKSNKKSSIKEKSGEGWNLYTNYRILVSNQPKRMTIFGETFEVKAWTKAAITLFKYLYKEDSAIFLKAIEKNRAFSRNKETFSRALKIAEGLYFNGRKYPIDIVYIMSEISERYLSVLDRDVRKGVEFFFE